MSAILILLATEAGPRPQDGSSRQTGKYGRYRNIPQRMLPKNGIDAISGRVRSAVAPPSVAQAGVRRQDTPWELKHCFKGYFSLLFSYQVKLRSFNPNGRFICLSGRLL